jgi:acylphosphatase
MTGEARTIRRLIISGRVQGVGFRAWVEDQATERQLQGWVRNRRDGTVEAVIAGTAEAVTEMIGACHRGPWLAKVTGVDIAEADEKDLALRHAAAGFSQLPTA